MEMALSCHATGSSVCWSMFTGMKWLVPMMRIPRFSASMLRPRPVTMCDWKCTTSGWTASRIRALFWLMFHGRANRSQSCGYQRQLRRRCAVISWPSWTSVHVPCLRLAAGATMCTSWPRRTSPPARRSAKRAAPFTSGGNVSAPMRMRSGRPGVAGSREVCPEMFGKKCLSSGVGVRRASRGSGRRGPGVAEQRIARSPGRPDGAPASGQPPPVVGRPRRRPGERVDQDACGWCFASWNTPMTATAPATRKATPA